MQNASTMNNAKSSSHTLSHPFQYWGPSSGIPPLPEGSIYDDFDIGTLSSNTPLSHADKNSLSSSTSLADDLTQNVWSRKRQATEPCDATFPSPRTGSPVDSDRATKRQKNTEAARRYRQRKTDRVTDLEEALAAMQKERDDLKVELARSQAEADVLRRMVDKGR